MLAVGNPVSMEYVNYRGERSLRAVWPISLWHGSTKWHPEKQWFFRAFDMDKGEQRDFALRDCSFRTQGPDWEGFGRRLMEEGWPVYDIDGGTVFEAAKMFGLIRVIPGGFDPEKHEDTEGLDPEPGEEWYDWGFPPENSGDPEDPSPFAGIYGLLNTDAGPVDREAPTNDDRVWVDGSEFIRADVVEKMVWSGTMTYAAFKETDQ